MSKEAGDLRGRVLLKREGGRARQSAVSAQTTGVDVMCTVGSSAYWAVHRGQLDATVWSTLLTSLCTQLDHSQDGTVLPSLWDV